MGRKPNPTAIRELQGNPRQKPLPEGEPVPPDAQVEQPDFLTPLAVEFWNSLAPLLRGMRVLTVIDAAALVVLAETWAEWREACQQIEKRGIIYTVITREGETTYRTNPAVAVRADAARRLNMLFNEFGLTPAARTKININVSNPNDGMEDFLKGRKIGKPKIKAKKKAKK